MSAALCLRGPGGTIGLIVALEVKDFTEVCLLNQK